MLIFFLSSYRYLGGSSTDRREILHGVDMTAGQVFSPLGAVPQGLPKSEILGLNFGPLTANILKMVSRSVTSIRARQELSENVNHRAVPPPGVR